MVGATHVLVELTGSVNGAERVVRVLEEDSDLDLLYALRDQRNAASAESGPGLKERRFAVRAKR